MEERKEEKPKYPEQTLVFVERRHEYDDVYTYVFKTEEKVKYTAGQYGHVRVSGMPEGVRSVREFSFASAPHDALVEFGVDCRSGSEYQKCLLALTSGETVRLFKIKNHMTWPTSSPDAVMIAGGVGITPFRSMLRDKAQKKISLHTSVIHVSGSGYLYGEEVAMSADEYIQTKRERLPESVSLVSDTHPTAHYYVAGSPLFVERTLELLSEKGISAESDSFKGLEEI